MADDPAVKQQQKLDAKASPKCRGFAERGEKFRLKECTNKYIDDRIKSGKVMDDFNKGNAPPFSFRN